MVIGDPFRMSASLTVFFGAKRAAIRRATRRIGDRFAVDRVVMTSLPFTFSAAAGWGILLRRSHERAGLLLEAEVVGQVHAVTFWI